MTTSYGANSQHAQTEMFAPPAPAKPGVVARIVELLDRDAPWTREFGGNDVEYRVYLLLCSYLSHADLSKWTSKLVPLTLKLRDFLRPIDSDDARAFVNQLDELFPGIPEDK